MTSIPFSSILEGERARKDYGDLSGLRQSLLTLGSISPLVLFQNRNNTYSLVAGGRRYRCLKQMGVTELFHGSILTPGKYGYLFDSEIDEATRKEVELHENLYRLATKWQEDVLLVHDVHALKRKTAGTKDWGQKETAALLGPGYSIAQVNLALKVAKYIREGNKEILAAESLSDANRIRMKWASDKGLAELSKRANAKAPTASLGTSSFLDSFSVSLKEGALPQTVLTPSSTPGVILTQAPLQPTEKVIVPLSSMFICGRQEEVSWPLVDHIVTDIPYGIDMDNLDEAAVVDVKETHDVEQNVSMMRDFLQKAFIHIKPGGFCVFFYDLDHHEKLQAWAKDVGFRVQRWPFIATKSSPCRNQAAQYNTTKNYECAMILRKDGQTTLRKAVPTSWREYNFAAERQMYNNPFAKPFALWKDLYDMITFPGQSVLDPFAGEMSACRAAANCGLLPFGVEVSEQHYNRGLQHMRNVYNLIHKNNVEFA